MSGQDEFDNLDLESMDIGACREKVRLLLMDKERRQEYVELAQNRIKECNNELAARREQEIELAQALDKERLENMQKQEEQSQALVVESDPEQLARDHLEGVLRKAAPPKKKELSCKFDGTSLIVKRPDTVLNPVDTILITYNPPGSASFFKLTYRVDEQTTVGVARVDACQYWRVSDVEFVLKTHNGSKVLDNLKIKDVFGSSEIRKFRLEKKSPKTMFLTDGENRAILPKQGRKRKIMTTTNKTTTQDVDNDDGVIPANERFNSALDEFPGLKEFCHLRDLDQRWHLKTIKLRDIFIFLALLLISMTLLFSRTSSHKYLATIALNNTTTYLQMNAGPEPKMDFKTIVSVDDTWDWLTYTIPELLLDGESAYQKANDLVGFVELRQRRVAPRDKAECEQPHIVGDEIYDSCVDRTPSCCVHRFFNADTEERTEHLDEIAYAFQHLPITVGRDTTVSPA
eukprot:gene86-54_t